MLEQAALTDRANHGRRVVRAYDRQLRHAVLVQQRDGVAHPVMRLHRDERGDLARVALAVQHVANQQLGVAVQEPVLPHPGVGVDLGQIRTATVGEDHHDHRLGVLDLLGDL